MDFLGGGLNAATAAATGVQEGQEKGTNMMRQIYNQTIANEKSQAETEQSRAHTRVFQNEANAPQPGTQAYYDNLRLGATAKGEGENVPKLSYEQNMNPILAQRTQGNLLAEYAPNVTAAKKLDFSSLTPAYAARAGATAQAEVAPHISTALGISHGEMGDKEHMATFEGGVKDAVNANEQARGFVNEVGKERDKEGGSFFAPRLRQLRGNGAVPVPAQAPSNQKVIRDPKAKPKTGNVFIDSQ